MALSVWARVAIVLFSLSTATAADLGDRVTESDAIRLFLEQSPQARRIPLIGQSADAEWRREARLSNPEVAYQIEDAAGVRDEFLTFQQELPITGRRGLVRETAEAAASAFSVQIVASLPTAT